MFVYSNSTIYKGYKPCSKIQGAVQESHSKSLTLPVPCHAVKYMVCQFIFIFIDVECSSAVRFFAMKRRLSAHDSPFERMKVCLPVVRKAIISITITSFKW